MVPLHVHWSLCRPLRQWGNLSLLQFSTTWEQLWVRNKFMHTYKNVRVGTNTGLSKAKAAGKGHLWNLATCNLCIQWKVCRMPLLIFLFGKDYVYVFYIHALLWCIWLFSCSILLPKPAVNMTTSALAYTAIVRSLKTNPSDLKRSFLNTNGPFDHTQPILLFPCSIRYVNIVVIQWKEF